MSVANSLDLVAGVLDKALSRWEPTRVDQAKIERLRNAIRGLAEAAVTLDRARRLLFKQTPEAAGRFADEDELSRLRSLIDEVGVDKPVVHQHVTLLDTAKTTNRDELGIARSGAHY